MASRTPYNSGTIGPIAGPSYMDNVRDRVKDLWDTSSIQLETIAGTGNAITASCDPPLTAGVTIGMKFSLIAANTNTTGVTISIDGGSAINLRDDNGNALIAGSIVAGRLYTLESDGANLRVQNSSGVVKINNLQLFTASGTWTKPAGTPNEALVTIKVWAGGGGGGSNNTGAAGGGGGGGYLEFTCRAADLASSVAITIGAGGAAGAAGGTSSFGTLVIAFGGGAGGQTVSSNNKAGGGGGGGGGLNAGGNGGANQNSTGNATSAAGGAGGDNTAGVGGNGSVTAGNAGASTTAGTGFFGGGGGGGSADGGLSDSGTDGGKSVFGGGGGAGRFGTSGGISIFGGNGGAPTVAGSAPGGGGGNNAAGARGEIRVYVNG